MVLTPLVLVVGGAGFIGRHTVALLLDQGYEVRVLDAFLKPTHPKGYVKGRYPVLDKVEMMAGDARDPDTASEALHGSDFVINLAAKVAIGQSMYRPRDYTRENAAAAATLWQAIVSSDLDLKRFVQASTMSIYGEGAYRCPGCGPVYPEMRISPRGGWNPACPECGSRDIESVPTPEKAPAKPTSVYALTKHFQESLCLIMSKTYSVPAVALRYFNVIGEGQSLSNPYTGVASIFYNAMKKGEKAQVFEDGRQSRDFVYVKDAARANVLALTKGSGVYNIGSGERHTVLNIAEDVAEFTGRQDAFRVTETYRKGDVRHIWADITKAGAELGYSPETNFSKSLRRFLEWASGEKDSSDPGSCVKEAREHGIL